MSWYSCRVEVKWATKSFTPNLAAHWKISEFCTSCSRDVLYKAMHTCFDRTPINADAAEKIEYCDAQNVFNPKQVPPSIPRSSHASQNDLSATFDANDGDDGANSVGADGARASAKAAKD
ncbi:hypothetical protein CJ030_MR2G020025 [Morella rubra]|uniref:Uncharacterized protein n=1 Tax=Morella rubra TaxID=262757 RepID=A0A6A1WCF1_9ROSI|nr:hypothetical protein CJ030_MR2G020025 [Morella rubra]